jgi:hypothetical protein
VDCGVPMVLYQTLVLRPSIFGHSLMVFPYKKHHPHLRMPECYKVGLGRYWDGDSKVMKPRRDVKAAH